MGNSVIDFGVMWNIGSAAHGKICRCQSPSQTSCSSQGAPGARGPVGEKGEQGDPGEDGRNVSHSLEPLPLDLSLNHPPNSRSVFQHSLPSLPSPLL